MRVVTATRLRRQLGRFLTAVARGDRGVLITRNGAPIAMLRPTVARQSALQAMGDLYRTLPQDAAAGWTEGTRNLFAGETAAPAPEGRRPE